MSKMRSPHSRNRVLLIRKTIFVAGLLTLTGCASFIKAGSINKVHESFNAQRYQETLSLIRRAESLNRISPYLVAELTYMKARSLEELGDSREANALYGFLISQHIDTQYAWLAELRLDIEEVVVQPKP